MRITTIFCALLLALALTSAACSGTQSTAQLGVAPSPLKMYPLSAEAADKVLATAMSVEFAGSPISRVDLPNKGYQATVRFLFDSHVIVAYMIPASGRNAAGTLVDGYAFEVSNAGTMPFSGGSRATRIFNRIVAEAESQAPGLPFVAFKR